MEFTHLYSRFSSITRKQLSYKVVGSMLEFSSSVKKNSKYTFPVYLISISESRRIKHSVFVLLGSVLRMWRASHALQPAGRGAVRLCSNSAPQHLTFSSQLKSLSRPQAEKQKRRRVREEAILSSGCNVSGEKYRNGCFLIK